jgi:hypothetical protein
MDQKQGAGHADFVAQGSTQLIRTGTVRGCEFNFGSIIGSMVGGGTAAGFGSFVAGQARSLGSRGSQLVGVGAAFDPGLYPSIAGNLVGQKTAGGCGGSNPASGTGRSSK